MGKVQYTLYRQRDSPERVVACCPTSKLNDDGADNSG